MPRPRQYSSQLVLPGSLLLLILAWLLHTHVVAPDLAWEPVDQPGELIQDAMMGPGGILRLSGDQLREDALTLAEGLAGAERLAGDTEGQTWFWTTSSGRLYRKDGLGVVESAVVEGDVIINLTWHSRGELGVLHAPFLLSSSPMITVLSGDDLSKQWQKELSFAGTHLLAHPQGWVYIQANGRVGFLDPAGVPGWQQDLDHEPTAAQSAPSGRTLIGDRRGGVTLLGSAGDRLWRFRASPYPISRLGWTLHDDHLLFAAIDNQNQLSLLDSSGRTRGRWSTGLQDPVLLVAESEPRQLLLLSRTGETQAVAIPAVLYAPWQPALKSGLLLLAGLSGIAVLVLLLSRFRATRTHLRGAAHGMWSSRGAYAFLLPAFLFLGLFCYLPAVSGLAIAFTDYSLTRPAEFIGLRNFLQLTGDPYFRTGLFNLCILLATGLIKAFTLPLLAAELIFWLSSERLKRWLRTAFILPAMVPLVVTLLVWKLIYNPSYGFLNQVLEAMGLGHLQTAWLAEESTALGAIIFFGFPWIGIVPFLLFFGGLITIPRDVFEASQVDGARPWRRFLNVDLPLLVPQFKLIAILVFIDTIQNFAVVLLLTGGGPGFTTYVPPLQMFYETVEAGNLGYASAIGVTLFLFVLSASWLIHRIPEPGR